MDYLYDSFGKKIDVLSKAIEKATDRARTMLYVVTFFSILIFVVSFNAYWSWDRKLNADERALLALELNLIRPASLRPFNDKLASRLRESNNEVYKYYTNADVSKNIAGIVHDLRDNREYNSNLAMALDEYLDSLESNDLLLSKSEYFKVYWERQKFTIPIIGLSCYADDVYLVGGICLSILLTYSFFSVRREGRIVDRMKQTIEFVRKRKASDFMNVGSREDAEIALIRHNIIERIFYGCVEFFIFNTGQTREDFRDGQASTERTIKTNKVGRKVLQVSYYLPVLSLAFAFSLEITSLVQRIQYVNAADLFELGLRYAFAIGFIIIVSIQCYVINQINKQNAQTIDDMLRTVMKSRKNLGLN